MFSRGRLALVVVAAVAVLAACKPIPQQPPLSSHLTLCDQAVGSSAQLPATEYVAVVDPAGDAAPHAETFVAASEAEKQQEVAQLTAEQGPVVAVAPNATLSAQVNQTNDPRYSVSKQQKVAIDQLRFVSAWTQGVSGAGVTIAVLDTGVLGDHRDLASAVVPGPDFVDNSGNGNCNAGPGFDPSHGTHVAGILGQRDNDKGGIGGSPDVRIMAVRVLNSAGRGGLDDVFDGIVWAASQGARVINMSLGGPATADPNHVLQPAINYALAHGSVLVAAAGNDGVSAAFTPATWYPEVIAVGAVQTGTGFKAAYSNYGANVDVAAPGSGIDSTLSDSTAAYGTKSGTSMSTPFVSAIAALMLQKCPGLTAPQITSKLQSSGTPLPQTASTPIGPLANAGAAVANAC